MTDISGIINVVCNDLDMHNLTMIFGGVLYEFIFSESITEDIVLTTKSINAIVKWAELDIPFESTIVELYYYDGTTWNLIETTTTDISGLAQFSALVMGEYMVCEVGDMNTEVTFMLEQDTIIFVDDIFVMPEKSIIQFNYADSILGADIPVDLTTITYDFMTWSQTSGVWVQRLPEQNSYLEIVVDEVSGTITIYEDTEGWGVAIYIGNSWDTSYEYTIDISNVVLLTAKSLEATVTWSSDSKPAAGILLPLYYFDGAEYVFIANYETDEFGVIYITELLPIGDYKIGETLFNIIADDIEKIVEVEVESLLGKRKIVFFYQYIFGMYVGKYFFLFYGVEL